MFFNNNEIGQFNDPSKIFELERVYLDNPITDSKTYKLLGVYFDEYLNFDKLVSYLCSKIARSIVQSVVHPLKT